MYEAKRINGEPVVTFEGEIAVHGFNYLAEAQERADELNEEHGCEESN